MDKKTVYDEFVGLVKMPNAGPNYHSRLSDEFVHPLRESIEEALRLFDGGENIQNALKITSRVTEYQNKDEHSPYYGLWPYYAEEPIEKMMPPDFNWADFIGKQLLVIYIDHFKYLSDSLKEKIKQAAIAACKCIIKRNERVSYTNVAMMDSFMCGVCGELFSIEEFFEYGANKLKRLLEFTRSDGNISEYNSPVYTLVALGDANYLRYYIKNAEMKKNAETFYGYLWKSLAEHYHVQTGELSGPQSRNYSTFLTDEQKNIILCAAGIKAFDENVPQRDRIYVPDEQKSNFTAGKEKYEIVRISNGFCYPCFANSKLEMLYMTNNFCMGSYQHEEMWNQTRPFLGFFGDELGKYAFRISVLHDEYDFSDAEIHTGQYLGRALGVINFAADRGDTHICLDFIKNKTVKAHDIRVRFSILGDIARLSVKQEHNCLRVSSGFANIQFEYVEAVFDGKNADFELSKENEHLFFDCVLYSGDEKDIVFDFGSEKYCVYAFDNSELGNVECTAENGRVNARYKNISVSTQADSVPFTMLSVGDIITIDGKNVEDLAENKLDTINSGGNKTAYENNR